MSLKVKISSSFLSNSAFKGPTPFKYSMGLDNMLFADEIMYFFLQR